jgi:Cu(I)/Ag(I) efflux system periplasmic protein CusF
MLRPLIVPIALIAAACSPPAQQEAAKTDDINMAENAAPAVAGPITGVGTVTAIDAAAGTISLDHEPITAISWPAMSMQFTAENPAMLQGIAVGDRVSFEIKSATETSVVTMVQKQ